MKTILVGAAAFGCINGVVLGRQNGNPGFEDAAAVTRCSTKTVTTRVERRWRDVGTAGQSVYAAAGVT